MAHTVVDGTHWIEWLLLNGVTGDTTSDEVDVDTRRFKELKALINVGTAANVTVQGRSNLHTTFIPLHTAVTADGGVAFDAWPRIRVVSTGVTGALTVVVRAEQVPNA